MSSSRHVLLPSIASAALLLGACAGAPEAEKTASGGDHFPAEVTSCEFETTVDAAPERAVTVFQGATEVMLALGLEDRMIGTYGLDDAVAPEYQAAYDSVPVIDGDNAPSREYLLGEKADFVFLLNVTGLTKGNLSSHLSKLEGAGLVIIEKTFVDRRPVTYAMLSLEGREALEEHWKRLEAIRKSAKALKPLKTTS